jgi:hypothetical protein
MRFSASASPNRLAEQRADHENGRHAADLLGDMFPAPPLLTLDVENLLGELPTVHAR